jgi:predicted transcriptional regulator
MATNNQIPFMVFGKPRPCCHRVRSSSRVDRFDVNHYDQILKCLKLTMTQTTKVLTAHVPLPLADKIDQMAARLERSRDWIMKQALSAWIAREDERDRLTQEALADVDAGRVFDHPSVQRWADSLGTDRPLPAPCQWN